MPASANDLFDQNSLIARAEQLIAAAKAVGADQADAIVVRSFSLSVELRNGAVEECQSSEGDDLGLRVFVGRRQAVVSSNDVAADVTALAERAMAMARAAPEDKYAGLADAELLARDFPDLDLVDRDLPSVTRLEDLARAAEDAALAVKGVTKSNGASASTGIGGIVLVTSHGFQGAYFASHHGLSMSAIAGEGTAMETDYDHSSALHAGDLEPPETVGRNAGVRAVARLNPRKIATCKVPVVFEPRVARSLVAHLAGAVNGAAIARRTSFLRDKLGQQVFARPVTIIDDPVRRRGLRSRPFDGEGVTSRPLVLVENGVLRSWLLDCASARELSLSTTGHAQRGTSSAPSPGPSNLHMMPGDADPATLIADIKEGLYVTELIGMGVNMVTGDYSRGAAGFWIENGERTYPVSEVTIAGNLLDMFRSLTPANDLSFRYATNAPTLRVEGLTVAGR